MNKPRITKLFELTGNILTLYEGTTTVNPYDCMVEKIDLSGYFFRAHKEDVYRLYHLLVHCITCLNSLYRLKDKQGRFTSMREDNILALHLLSEECFSHEYLPGSVQESYRRLMSYYGTVNTFTRRQATIILDQNPHTAKWHIKKLAEYGYLIKTGGDNHRGYSYRLIDKMNPFLLVDTLEESKDPEKEKTVFETMLPEIKISWPM